jgi:hypothetical protein
VVCSRICLMFTDLLRIRSSLELLRSLFVSLEQATSRTRYVNQGESVSMVTLMTFLMLILCFSFRRLFAATVTC